jgi:hypothetical protein
MRILEAIRAGLKKVNNNLHFIGLLWIVNIAFAMILSMTLYRLLNADLSGSLVGDSLLQGFEFRWYQEFFFKYETTLEMFTHTLTIVGSIFILIQTFLLGGILTVLNSAERKTLFIDFFYGGVQYFYRFFKILLLSMLFYLGLFFINRWGTAATENLLGASESEALRISVIVIRYILLALIFFCLNIVFDYTKIRVVVHQETKILREWWRAVKFTVSHAGSTIGLFVLLFLLGAGIFGVYYSFEDIFLPISSYGMIFLVFMLHQIYIGARLWLRMMFYASQLALWKEIHAEVIVPSVEENSVHVHGE